MGCGVGNRRRKNMWYVILDLGLVGYGNGLKGRTKHCNLFTNMKLQLVYTNAFVL